MDLQKEIDISVWGWEQSTGHAATPDRAEMIYLNTDLCYIKGMTAQKVEDFLAIRSA